MKNYTKTIISQLRYPVLAGVGLLYLVAFATPATVSAQNAKVYSVVEEMPEIKGGLPALYKKIEYPEEARKKGISGRVFLQVIVDENGNALNPKILKGIGGGCGEAAAEAIKKIKFKPGKHKGKVVKVKYSLPVTFRIQS